MAIDSHGHKAFQAHQTNCIHYSFPLYIEKNAEFRIYDFVRTVIPFLIGMLVLLVLIAYFTAISLAL